MTKAEQLREQVENLEHEYHKKSKMQHISKKKESEIIQEKANNEASKEKIKVDLQLMT